MKLESFERTGSFHPGIAERIRNEDALKLELGTLGADAGMLIAHIQEPWPGASRSGTRHRLTYFFEGDAAVDKGDFLIIVLPEHDFTVPHQVVADQCIVEVDHRLGPCPRLEVTLEVLLLDTEG